MSSIRKLIEQALEEARDEFAAIIARKVAEVMGDVAGGSKKRGRPSKLSAAPRASKRPSIAQGKSDGRRSRAPRHHMDQLRDKILGAMQSGAPMKRSQIVAAAKLDGSEAQRVAQVLKRLKDEGLLSMTGQKASATYKLRNASS